MRTTLLMFHPDPQKSKADRALADAAAKLDAPALAEAGPRYADRLRRWRTESAKRPG